MSRAWIGLGANLGQPDRTLPMALAALQALPMTTLRAVSPAYWTQPWGLPDQPEFLNAVALVETGQEPLALLRTLLAIESGLGRRRDQARWGPRAIDLDLLLFGDRVVDEAELTLPHPRMHERAFVLVPLADLAPTLIVPGRGRVEELLDGLSEEELDGVRAAACDLSRVTRPT